MNDKFCTGPLPHPATQREYPVGGREGERAGVMAPWAQENAS